MKKDEEISTLKEKIIELERENNYWQRIESIRHHQVNQIMAFIKMFDWSDNNYIYKAYKIEKEAEDKISKIRDKEVRTSENRLAKI